MAHQPPEPEERDLTADLTPHEVEALNKRRDLGHTLLVIAGQFAVVAMVLLLWVYQDLSYSPGWAHPTAFYLSVSMIVIAACGIAGLLLRRSATRTD